MIHGTLISRKNDHKIKGIRLPGIAWQNLCTTVVGKGEIRR
jgi:hypothetical protein